MNYFQKETETMPVSEIKKLQSEKLVRQVRHVYEHVEPYRRKMDELGVKPEDIRGIEDLPKLPFVTKNDLRDEYPKGFLAVPVKDCVRIHSTSGTTGRRVVAFYTQHDIDLWEECCARAIVAAGGSNEDVVQVAYGYGLFTGGSGLHGGSHKVGCLTLPMSSGNTDRQIQFMMDLGATFLCCTPSYAAYLGESLKERGISPDQNPLKAGIFGAEPWTENMRHMIEDELHIKAYDIYGLSEVMGPGVACDCEFHKGLHVHDDHFYPEIIDPETLEPVGEGVTGELVFTTLTKEGLPLIRYRTKDLTSIEYGTCECGRTQPRIQKFKGRSDDMLIIRGVNVFPSQVEAALLEMEVDESYFDDDMRGLDNLSNKVKNALKQALGLAVKVKLVEPKTLPRYEGKSVHVIDNRKLV